MHGTDMKGMNFTSSESKICKLHIIRSPVMTIFQGHSSVKQFWIINVSPFLMIAHIQGRQLTYFLIGQEQDLPNIEIL